MPQFAYTSRLKTFLLYYLPLAVLIFLLGIAITYQQRKTFLADIELSEANVVEMEKRLAEASLVSYISDAITLGDIINAELKQGKTMEQIHKMLVQFFLIFTRHHTFYDQVRFIDADGMERIRINQTRNNKTYVTPERALQDKRNREYFKKAMSIEEAVYISRFDLNVENEIIERPYKPMIRVAYPIDSPKGKKLGIIVLNVWGEDILGQLENTNAGSTGDMYLVNDKGHWLRGPAPDSEWLFMFDRPIKTSMPLRHPEAWERMKSVPEGQFQGPDGLYTYTTIVPRSLEKNYDLSVRSIRDDESWMLISFVPAEKLYPGWWGFAMAFMGFLFIATTVLSWMMADSRVRRERALHELEASERQLLSITETVLDAIIMIDSSGRASFWNQAAERMFGFTAQEVMGRNIHDFIASEEDQRASSEGLKNFDRTGTGPIIGVKREVTALRKSGDRFAAELNLNAVQIDGRWWCVGVVRDVADWKKAQSEILALNEDLEKRVSTRTHDLEKAVRHLDQRERTSNLLMEVASIANSARSVEEAFKSTLALVTRQIRWPIGHVYEFSEKEDQIVPMDIWQVESMDRFKSFVEITNNTTFRPGQGLPGLVYSTKQAHWIEDLSQEGSFTRYPLLEDKQVKSGFALPVFTDDKVTAVLEFYSDEITAPDESIMEMARQVGYHLGHVVERKRIEKSVWESEQKFRGVFDQSFQIMGVLSPDGSIVQLNVAALAFLGDSASAISGQLLWEIGWLRDKPGLDEKIRNAVAGAAAGEFVRLEIAYPDEDGQDRIMDFSIKPVLDEGGKVLYLIPEGRDITDFKRVQAEAGMLAMVAQKTVNGVLITDREGRIEWVNDAFSQMNGYTFEEQLGEKAWEFLNGPDTDRETARSIREACADAKGITVEILHYHKSGKAYWVEMDIQPLYDDDGRVEKFIAIANDITERRKADLALREFKTTLDQTYDAVFIFDPVTLRFTYVNQGAISQLGYSEEELLRIRPVDIKPLFTEELFIETVTPLIEGKSGSLSFETVHEHKDGHHIPVNILLQYVDRANEAPRFVAIVRDISEQKRVNAELELARDEAEAATQAKSQFLANMSHEIRTPMNAVIGMSHILLNSELSPKQRDQLNKILGASTSLLGVINDILDFSKIEAGRLELEVQPFKLDDMLTNLATVVRDRAEDKGIELIFDVGPDVPALLVGDPLRLGQVLTNLTTNAIKFTEQGYVVIRVEGVATSPGLKTLKFSVIDTGIGIPEGKQKELFEAFSQVDASTTRKYGGTGLGLTISRRLVELLGGRIGVESAPGLGSTFFFTIELECQKPDCSSHAPRATLEGTGILVLDDSEPYRPIYGQLLGELGAETVFADSGEQAVELLSQGLSGTPFSLLLLNLDMESLDGFIFQKRLQDDAAFDGLNILTMTAFPKRFQPDETHSPDLTKPLSRDVLIQAVLQSLGRGDDSADHSGVARLDIRQSMQSLADTRVLVAEDNQLNQEVARELLEAVSVNVTIVENGAQAVEAVIKEPFDAVLMDVQMPVMGGLEATRMIRKKTECETLPIIAMTAHAMAGDREKSLAAGMNAHITKPVDPQELYSTLIRWITGGQSPRLANPPDLLDREGDDAAVPPVSSGLDTRGGVLRVAGRVESYVRLLRDFSRNHHDELDKVSEAFELDDMETARQMAHSLKGVAGNVGAVELYELMIDLEKALRDNERAQIPSLLEKARAAMKKVLTAIEGYIADNESDASEDGTDRIMGRNELLQKFEKLSELLADDDASALRFVETFSHAVPSEIRPDMSKLVDQIQAFDFDEASRIVQQASNALKSDEE